ncbi:MAG: GTPase [archaeon]|nr:GTPase [archaeon]
MLIHIIGGFLGSGKTTLLMQIAKWYIDHKKTVVILENESGEIGVDATTINSNGLNAIELKNGCICCSLSGTLQSTLRSIEKELHPDILIIEPTGLALPHKVTGIIRGTVNDEKVSIIGICDAQRFLTLKERKEDFIRMQLAKSDVLWINKVDVASFEEVFEASSWLRKICPGTPLYMVSGKTGEGINDALSSPIFCPD